jgi:hypothetical protein
MKKIFTFAPALSMLLSVAPIPASAEYRIAVTFNGTELEFDQPPIIEHDRLARPRAAR